MLFSFLCICFFFLDFDGPLENFDGPLGKVDRVQESQIPTLEKKKESKFGMLMLEDQPMSLIVLPQNRRGPTQKYPCYKIPSVCGLLNLPIDC